MTVMDKRQRAMLGEMGVRVWQPLAKSAVQLTPATPGSPSDKPDAAIYSGAFKTKMHSSEASFNHKRQTVQAAPATARVEHVSGKEAWRIGAMQMLYADTAVQKAPRWLVLLEAPASALAGSFNPLEGDAGKLLDNMLRAAKLHVAGAVLLAPLVRNGAGGDLPGALTDVLASAQANVVLVMGRLAAQALLQSTEPLAKLRGQVHAVQGQQTVITIDPTYLLRNPLEKARAWDDLCLALSIISVAGRVSAP